MPGPNRILHLLEEHQHGVQHCYPTGTDGIVVEVGTAAWTNGNAVNLIAPSVITSNYDLHFINIEGVTDDAIYQLNLYRGTEATNLIAEVRFAVDATNQMYVPHVAQIMTPLLAANEAVSMKLMASSTGESMGITVSCEYHTY